MRWLSCDLHTSGQNARHHDRTLSPARQNYRLPDSPSYGKTCMPSVSSMIFDYLCRWKFGSTRACNFQTERGRSMYMPYAHLLQFRCRRCEQPIVLSVRSEAANLETVDGDSFRLECQCGWSETLLGVEAARHLVTLWHDEQQITDYLEGAGYERQSDPS